MIAVLVEATSSQAAAPVVLGPSAIHRFERNPATLLKSKSTS